MSRTHLVIPDCQVKPGCDISYLTHIGRYIVDKKPDVIVCIGDFADMPSLSSYDVHKKSYEGRRYSEDIGAVHRGMEALLTPLALYNAKAKEGKHKQYKPRLVMTLGNHEDRITRAIENDPKLEGTIGLWDLRYEQCSWEVYPFLQPVVIDGISYCHYFTTGVMGRAVTSARALLTKKHMSCTMGHVQNWDIARSVRGDGQAIMGLFCGSCYLHDEDYLGPQGNTYTRGIWMKYEVTDGDYSPLYVTLDYLRRKYGEE